MIEANKYFLAKDPDIVITSKDLSTNEVFKVSDSTLCARPRSYSGGLKYDWRCENKQLSLSHILSQFCLKKALKYLPANQAACAPLFRHSGLF